LPSNLGSDSRFCLGRLGATGRFARYGSGWLQTGGYASAQFHLTAATYLYFMRQTYPATNTLSPLTIARPVEHKRPTVRGKFIHVGGRKLYVRGVTYGTFRPDGNGDQYPCPEAVRRDFAQMADNGINAVRTYTVPPRWLLDLAHEQGLYVMVGLPWEQHIAFLGDKRRERDIEERVRAGVRACAGHPAVLCYAIGNEIPASIVRWYGARRIERFLARLYRAAKAVDPECLVTYVNYPTTEYLHLPFLDFLCFNVYLEQQAALDAYLARLQNIAGDRPLVMAEIGLDSRRNGEAAQARTLDWQVRSAFAAGCAGAFIFSWTDEWHRGGHDIADWDFGLTDRHRRPKPALRAVAKAFAEVPFPEEVPWPSISVVVCSRNGARTLSDCCEGLIGLDYPRYEVIMVDDGSTDATASIASEYGFRVISTENRGLSAARNLGMEAANGEIIAYTDDDARPDPHWLRYLAWTFLTTGHAGVGGPNISPPEDSRTAWAVANSPGGPTHVLLSDTVAEHIPGCNMAFRTSCLRQVGGFDSRFRTAGDDVDICWRMQQEGWTLGFSPAAMVWHRRRSSVRTYWRQQIGYGKAEALLERKWPEKYNSVGHLTWRGRLYGGGVTQSLVEALGWGRGRVYGGTWGRAPFQSVYSPASDGIWSLPLMPEWYLLALCLGGLSLLGLAWMPLLVFLPFFMLALAAPIVQAIANGVRTGSGSGSTGTGSIRLRALTSMLHMLQPLARLLGRLQQGLTPWRKRGLPGLQWLPWPRQAAIWREEWYAPEDWLLSLETDIKTGGAVVLRGGNFDKWDLEVRGGMLGSARALMAIEEHGGGRQMARFRVWPRLWRVGLALALFFGALSAIAAADRAWIACVALAVVALLLLIRALYECAAALSTLVLAVRSLPGFMRERG